MAKTEKVEVDRRELEILMAKASGIPIHIHTCTDCPEPHTWLCKSPYCESLNAPCNEHRHGGPKHAPTAFQPSLNS